MDPWTDDCKICHISLPNFAKIGLNLEAKNPKICSHDAVLSPTGDVPLARFPWKVQHFSISRLSWQMWKCLLFCAAGSWKQRRSTLRVMSPGGLIQATGTTSRPKTAFRVTWPGCLPRTGKQRVLRTIWSGNWRYKELVTIGHGGFYRLWCNTSVEILSAPQWRILGWGFVLK